MTAQDYLEGMNAPVPRRKPAPRLTREATAEKVADTLVNHYQEPKTLELILQALERRMRETGKFRILEQR